MTTRWPFVDWLLSGPLCSTAVWPCTLDVRLCDLRPRFRVKQTLRSGCRAIARNGRVLLCADRPLEELPGTSARLRLQTWHRVVLPGDAAEPYGILLCVRGTDDKTRFTPGIALTLCREAEAMGALRVEVGGGLYLDFRGLD
jgi:hypothetical protein